MQFCTYIHLKPNNDPFYVGSGSIERANNLSCARNRAYELVVRKIGSDNIRVLVLNKASEGLARIGEIHLIALLRGAGCDLVNKSKGGEGGTRSASKVSERFETLLVDAGIGKANLGRLIGVRASTIYHWLEPPQYAITYLELLIKFNHANYAARQKK